MESVLAARALGSEIMGHPDVLGKVLPGYYADVILVNGNPLEDISVFQDTKNIHAIVINGHVHKNSDKSAFIPRGSDHLPMRVVPEGESVIPVRVKGKPPKRAESPAEMNGTAAMSGKGSVGFFKNGEAEEGGPQLGQNGERSGVSAEVVKGT